MSTNFLGNVECSSHVFKADGSLFRVSLWHAGVFCVVVLAQIRRDTQILQLPEVSARKVFGY